MSMMKESERKLGQVDGYPRRAGAVIEKVTREFGQEQ